MSTQYLSAKQAASQLGVSVSTLYAYVSRGLIRSEPDPIKRRRRYRSEDIQSLLARKLDRGGAERALAGALHWGEPLCESELTLIQDGRLFYRGRDVGRMASENTLEETIELLWGAYTPASAVPVPSVQGLMGECEPMERFRLAMPWLEREEPLAYDLRPDAVRAMGARILASLFALASGRQPQSSLAQCLAESWAPPGRSLLEAALILCSDHELNVSAFTARCVASAGANPYQVVSGGLAALSGFRHGGETYRVEAFIKEVEASSPLQALESRLRRGEAVPGFGHRLYPDGDPRAEALLALMEVPDSAHELLVAAEELLGEKPTIDFALVTMSRLLELPPGGAIAVFALGRTVGWIAHSLEQYKSQKLIRPRARYIGALPEPRLSLGGHEA